MTETALSASLEDYLEAIYHIVDEKGAARPKDIAARLQVGSSSVTGALRNLAARDLVNYEPYDLVTLTTAGRSAAADVVKRHQVLSSFFTDVLAIDRDLAEAAACLMEHAVPSLVLQRFVSLLEFMKHCPAGGATYLEGVGFRCASGEHDSNCQACANLLQEPQKTEADAAGSRLSLDQLEPGGRAAPDQESWKSW